MWHGFRLDRSLYFAQGVVAGYVGLLRLLFQPFRHTESGIPYLLAALLGLGMLFVIFAAHRRMQEIGDAALRSEEHTSELQSRQYLVCRLLLDKKNIEAAGRSAIY